MQGRRGELVERTLQGRSAGGRIAAANSGIEGMAEKDARQAAWRLRVGRQNRVIPAPSGSRHSCAPT